MGSILHLSGAGAEGMRPIVLSQEPYSSSASRVAKSSALQRNEPRNEARYEQGARNGGS